VPERILVLFLVSLVQTINQIIIRGQFQFSSVQLRTTPLKYLFHRLYTLLPLIEKRVEAKPTLIFIFKPCLIRRTSTWAQYLAPGQG